MVKTAARTIAFIFCLLCGFAALADGPPTDSWIANLDEYCDPDDIVDILRAKLTPRTFWEEQEKDFEYFVRSSKKNIENTTVLQLKSMYERLASHKAELEWAKNCLAKARVKLKEMGRKP